MMGLLLIAVVTLAASWAAAYFPRRGVDFYSVDGVFHETAVESIRRGRGTRGLQETYLLDGYSGSQNENPLLLAVVLARLPRPLRLWLQRHGSGILLGVLAFAPAASAAGDGRLGPALAAVAVVLGTPMLVRESIGFNARLPGVLAVSVFWWVYGDLRGGDPVLLVAASAAVVSCTALLHRLSLQAIAFTAVTLAATYADSLPLVALGVGWLAAFAIAPSHYRNVFAAHCRLLRLHRQTRDLNHKALAAYLGHAESVPRPPWWRPVRLLGAGGATLLMAPWVATSAGQSPAVAVAVSLSAVAIATTVFPPLRFMGEGERYFEFAAVATASAVAARPLDAVAVALIAAGIAVSAAQYRKLWRTARDEFTPALRAPLHAALVRVRDEPDTRILSLPMWTARFTAYVADKQVYEAAAHRTWVTCPHYAPVLTAPVRTAVADLGLQAALVDTRVCLPQLAEIEAIAELRWELGPYRYYRF